MYFSNLRTNLGVALLCTTSAIALSSTAQAQDTSAETVVVTGSRVIADAANSPTPLTVVTTAQLSATTPTKIADALNKLPAFVGSNSARISNNPSNNYSTDALNMRNFGPQRTLVLLDGRRAVPSNADGTVNIDTLPQMLVNRVDVVTGGASAVYGSDAVTGVVNFVLDKHFTGLKVDVNAGISNYSDSASYNVGAAAGADLFGGRGHFEGEMHVFHEDMTPAFTRHSQDRFLLTGAGTAAAPYATLGNTTDSAHTFGGKITCTGCAANGQQFIANGVLGPFTPGTPTGTAGIQVGGDGAYFNTHALTSMVSTEDAFGRFSYNINDDTTFFVQASVNQSYDKTASSNQNIAPGTSGPNTFFYNNPYLSTAAQAALKPATGSTFQLVELVNQFGPWSGVIAQGLDNATSVTAGVDGTIFGKYDWSAYYTHGYDRLKESDPHNQDLQKEWAANDAVSTPGGGVACYVSTTTYASLYPGCVPINPFGPTALTVSQYNYIINDTNFIMQHDLDDVGGSVSGELFNDWAGPVKAALSGEMRWMDLSVQSNATPGNVNCTGLRLCNTLVPHFQSNTIGSLPTVSENVWEFAGEMNVPLLKDVPLVKDLSLDLAGRYTDYSTSGAVETWKIGFDYHVNDEVRFRGTTSVDIRAPTLYDLYQPAQFAPGGYTDIHTNQTGSFAIQSSGNPNLVPEISRTYTGGVVFTPDFIPGLTASVDYFLINMKNAISSVTGHDAAEQNLCEQSGGTSTYCALFTRPLPFSNTTTFNYPSAVYAYSLNAAFQKTEGWDIEIDYAFQLADVWADAPGSVSLRSLVNYSPVLESIPYPTAPLTFTGVKEVTVTSANTVTSKGHVTSFLSYNLGTWGFNLSDRWIAGYNKAYQFGLVYVPGSQHVNSVNYQDITIDKKFNVDGQTLDGYLSIQNVGNVLPPINLVNNQNVPGAFNQGINYSDASIYDAIGRYFTIGLRANF